MTPIEKSVKSQIAIVTGAARGIGEAIARRLAADGLQVVGFDQAWESRPAHLISALAVDVSDFGAVDQAIGDVEALHGPIGIVVNNAGITRDAMSHKMDPQDFRRVIDVNLVGPFNLCRATLTGMRDRGYGRIVNISSMNALRGQYGQANYAAAKAGLIAMTKSIALETAAKGITANCIAPGFIETDMTRAMRPDIREAEIAKIPSGRIGTVEDVANAVSYLASDAASFMTGQVMSVNGGQHMP
ncbi:3-oxoacyl-ACP reductase [Allorhizobium pseudoryzae]|jgi:acetoacetyl-CoA reductase|uniref:3-oxoacyl-ACP reductase n=1 Tax=Allorhizobium pseudoryzae TaxID=379684 RepID=UPI003CFF1121